MNARLRRSARRSSRCFSMAAWKASVSAVFLRSIFPAARSEEPALLGDLSLDLLLVLGAREAGLLHLGLERLAIQVVRLRDARDARAHLGVGHLDVERLRVLGDEDLVDHAREELLLHRGELGPSLDRVVRERRLEAPRASGDLGAEDEHVVDDGGDNGPGNHRRFLAGEFSWLYTFTIWHEAECFHLFDKLDIVRCKHIVPGNFWICWT